MFRVEVNRARCEGKAACEAVCPEDVFNISQITDADYARLSFLSRVKSRLHGLRTAYAVNEADCSGCLKCVEACPENAITVTR
jgi:NAD-dependent dihydropyrimidine dehydrogenase PreA subunit